MEKKSYTYGSKLAGMILHLFFNPHDRRISSGIVDQ